MTKTVADGMWEMLVTAGVRRCYRIVGDALNPTTDALRRNGSVDFVSVRHEEYGVFAAVADACLRQARGGLWRRRARDGPFDKRPDRRAQRGRTCDRLL